MKKAFITGISGQDGAYLARLLLEKGYHVSGGIRNPETAPWRLQELGIAGEIELLPFDICDKNSIEKSILQIKPDEVYNLAAQSSVARSFTNPVETALVDAMGVVYLLEAIRCNSNGAHFFQAGSTEMFGQSENSTQDEFTHFAPNSPYSCAKVYAFQLTANYRNIYKLFTVNGILFNHDSELRGSEFFTRSVTAHVAMRSLGQKSILQVGNIDSERDIGYAKEFVEAMYLTLQYKQPEDFVIATGTKIKIREFISYSFEYIGINIIWKGKGFDEEGIDSKTGEILVKVNPINYRPSSIDSQMGNPSKIEQLLNWKAKITPREVAHKMVQNDINKISNAK
jgi:GDPmannose 4,6-dehydratase